MNWQSAVRKLEQQVSQNLDREIIQYYVGLNEAFCLEAESPDLEPCTVKLLRSMWGVSLKVDQKSLRTQLADIMKLFQLSPQYPLPTVVQLKKDLFSPFKSITDRFPDNQISLSLSTPVGFPNRVSLNVADRYYDLDHRLKLKLKIGIFSDDQGDFYWLNGCIDPDKAIAKINAQMSLLDLQTLVEPYMMKQSTQATFEQTKYRDYLKGLDLSPAFYHVALFSLWVGGHLIDPIGYKNYKRDLQQSIEYSIRCHASYMMSTHSELYTLAKEQLERGRIEPTVVSLLLHNRMILDFRTHEFFPWIPPRILMSKTSDQSPY